MSCSKVHWFRSSYAEAQIVFKDIVKRVNPQERGKFAKSRQEFDSLICRLGKETAIKSSIEKEIQLQV